MKKIVFISICILLLLVSVFQIALDCSAFASQSDCDQTSEYCKSECESGEALLQRKQKKIP